MSETSYRVQRNSPGLGPERVRSATLDICFNNSSYTFCFHICFSFQQSTSFSNPFSLICNDSAIQSVFHTNFEPSPLFSAQISNSASTAARTTVSCLYSAHARLPLREPPGLRIGTCLSLAGHRFLKQFLDPFFHTQIMFLIKHNFKID